MISNSLNNFPATSITTQKTTHTVAFLLLMMGKFLILMSCLERVIIKELSFSSSVDGAKQTRKLVLQFPPKISLIKLVRGELLLDMKI